MDSIKKKIKGRELEPNTLTHNTRARARIHTRLQEVTQRLTGVVSVRIKWGRVIYACQVSVATTVHEWPRIKGARILADLPFTDRTLRDPGDEGWNTHREMEQREREERVLTKCNDYRFQCNILYNAVTMTSTAKNTSDLVSARECDPERVWEWVVMFFNYIIREYFSRAPNWHFWNIKTKSFELNTELKFHRAN